MNPCVIANQTAHGIPLQATFLPDKGMNMISFKWGEIELIDQSTWNIFEERFAGLGALIGPHFHHRKPEAIPRIENEALFPHIARVKAKGTQEPFSHGIARYAPWRFTATEQRIIGTLTGQDKWQGISLAKLEGQAFTMNYSAEMTPTGLQIKLSITSEKPSLVGLHYYYALPQKTGRVIARVTNSYREGAEWKPFPAVWQVDAQQRLIFDLTREADYGFVAAPDARQGEVLLDTGLYRFRVHYETPNEENEWQLYHPKGATFVAIEPLSARNPSQPKLNSSSLKVFLSVDH